MITLPSPITGGAQTGFTSPTYSAVVDNAPDLRSKQWAITGVGGTQVGVNTHTPSNPFTITVKRPSVLKSLASAVLNGVTGQYSKVPSNSYDVLVRKGAAVSAASGQIAINSWRFTGQVFAGTDSASAPEVRAGLSCMIGFLNSNSAGLGDTAVTGIV